ncbi:unnamed protein product [Rotaria socialis]
MTVVSHDIHPYLHFIGAFGMFILISVYCIFHTFVVFYLYVHRSKAPEHSNVILPLWFLACTVLLVIFFVVWIETHQSIPQYIAAGMPFLYFVGFVPQFWKQATMAKQTYCAPGSMHDPSVTDGMRATKAMNIISYAQNPLPLLHSLSAYIH